MNRIELTMNDCEDVLNRNIVLGLDSEIKKTFLFNAWTREYCITQYGQVLCSGKIPEGLLKIYNDL